MYGAALGLNDANPWMREEEEKWKAANPHLIAGMLFWYFLEFWPSLFSPYHFHSLLHCTLRAVVACAINRRSSIFCLWNVRSVSHCGLSLHKIRENLLIPLAFPPVQGIPLSKEQFQTTTRLPYPEGRRSGDCDRRHPILRRRRQRMRPPRCPASE